MARTPVLTLVLLCAPVGCSSLPQCTVTFEAGAPSPVPPGPPNGNGPDDHRQKNGPKTLFEWAIGPDDEKKNGHEKNGHEKKPDERENNGDPAKNGGNGEGGGNGDKERKPGGNGGAEGNGQNG